MCSTPEDLRRRAGWDGARGTSRTRLLNNLQSTFQFLCSYWPLLTQHDTEHIPSAVMIPQRRFLTLLEQSRLWQQQRCPYHNSPPDSLSFSLYRDHHCDSSCFPNTTTTILEVHTDEVWNIEWSHSGEYLASASKDKSAVIWRVGVSSYHPLFLCSADLGLRSPRKSQPRGSTHSTSYCGTTNTQWDV